MGSVLLLSADLLPVDEVVLIVVVSHGQRSSRALHSMHLMMVVVHLEDLLLLGIQLLVTSLAHHCETH